MPVIHLAKRKLEALKPEAGNKRTTYSDADCRGLRLTVSTGGRRVWSTTYQLPGQKQTWFTIGVFPVMDLHTARHALHMFRDKISDGWDPKDKQTADAGTSDTETFSQLADRYIEQHAKPKKRTWKADERMIRKYLIPDIGETLAAKVKVVDVENILNKILAEGAKHQRDHVLVLTRSIYRWATRTDARKENGIRHDPTIGIEKAVTKQENIRDRYLDEEELQTFWKGLPESSIREDVKDIVRIALLTGCRSTEITGAKAKEFRHETIEIEGDAIKVLLWRIPAERVKNKHRHVLPLPPLLSSIIAPRLDDFLFPAKTQQGHVTAEYAVKEMQKALPDMSLERFGIKDLRTTVGTRLSFLGIDRNVISHVLNHRSITHGDVTGTHYIFDNPLPAMYLALLKLEQFLGSKPNQPLDFI